MPNTEEYFGSFTDTRDRRQYSRRTTALNYVELGDTNGGIVLNISEGGLALTAAEVLLEEYIPRIRFQLADDAQWMETSGRIVWLTDSKKSAGIEFVDLAEEDRNQIRQWISSRRPLSEIQDTARTVRKSRKEMEIPPPPKSRNEAPELKMVDDVDETQFEELFPSEIVPRLEAAEPTASSAPPPITPTNDPQTNGLAGHPKSVPLPVPDFGYQTRNDWSDWPDPATADHRSKLPLVVLGVLLTATSFAIGTALGHGSFEGLLESVRRLMPDKIQPGPSVAAPPPPAGSLAAHSSPSAVDAPGESADTSTHPAGTPASPIPSVSAGGNEETQETEVPSDAPRTAGSVENKPAITGEDREQILVTAPSEGDRPFRLTVPETAVSASSSVAISSQTSILVPPEPGPVSSHQPKRLQPGALIFHVEPLYPRGLGRKEIEIVKLRATVGENGQVIDVQRISGAMPLIPAVTSAIREWRYTPALLNGRPVKTEEDITIAFRAR